MVETAQKFSGLSEHPAVVCLPDVCVSLRSRRIDNDSYHAVREHFFVMNVTMAFDAELGPTLEMLPRALV